VHARQKSGDKESALIVYNPAWHAVRAARLFSSFPNGAAVHAPRRRLGQTWHTDVFSPGMLNSIPELLFPR